MSEVEQAAVSPSFILDLTETTQELGTSLLASCFPLFVVFVFLVPVWSEKRESDVCTWEL